MSWLGLLSVLALVSLSFITYFVIMACFSIMQASDDLRAIRERIEGKECESNYAVKNGRKAAIMAIITVALAMFAAYFFMGGINV